MKKVILFEITIIALLLFNSSAFGDQNLKPISIHERSYENNSLNTANSLIQQRKANEAIAMLKNYRENERPDFHSKFLLAEAYLEKCSQMKETNAVSDREYKRTVFLPFNMGKQIIIDYQYDNTKLSYGNYICAKSFLLNNRPQRAERYLGYAMEQCKSPDVNIYILKADISAENYYQTFTSKSGTEYPPNLSSTANTGSQYLDTIHAYEYVINSTNNDLIKSRMYYKLGVFELNIYKLNIKSATLVERSKRIKKAQEYFNGALKYADERSKTMSYYYLGIIQNELGNKAAAQTSFKSALTYATDSSLKDIIQKHMN